MSAASQRRSGPAPAAVAVLVGVLAVALAVLAFLLGRERGRREAAVEPHASPAEVARASTKPHGVQEQPIASEDPDAAETSAADADWFALTREADAATDAADTPPTTGVAAGSGDTAVSRYFAELDVIEREAKYWDDPQQLGMALVTQMQSGDDSELRRLLQSQREVLDRLRAVDAPPACGEHHRRSQDLLGRGIALLEQLRDAAGSGDAGALLSLPMQAQALAEEAQEVDALAAALRER